MLVDSGSRGDLVRIVAALRAHGADPKAPAAIVQTHGHADHAGCAASRRDLSDAPVIIHRDDAEMLRRGRNRPLRPTNLTGRLLLPLVDTPFPPLAPDIEVVGPLDLRPYGLDGQLLPLQGGHTAGSIALLLRIGAACVGDVLRGGTWAARCCPAAPTSTTSPRTWRATALSCVPWSTPACRPFTWATAGRCRSVQCGRGCCGEKSGERLASPQKHPIKDPTICGRAFTFRGKRQLT